MSAPRGEKRRSPRVQPYVVPCRVRGDGRPTLSAYVTDLSTGGAQVQSEREPPPIGTAVVVELLFGAGTSRARLQGEVKWSRPPDTPGGQHVFGVGFGATSAELAALEAALGEFRRRAQLLTS